MGGAIPRGWTVGEGLCLMALFLVVVRMVMLPTHGATGEAPIPPPSSYQSGLGASHWGLQLPERYVPRRITRLYRGENPKGEPLVLADLKGPGCIRRIWLTGGYGRHEWPGVESLVLRIYFDGEQVPYVEAPLTQFFGLFFKSGAPTHTYPVITPFFTVQFKSGFTCYMPMPFSESARVEIVGDEIGLGSKMHYQIDYHQYREELKEPMRFAARWRREAPVRDWEDEFIMLDADGPGRLVGYFYGVNMLHPRGTHRWSHAGADNLYIDGEGEFPAYLRGDGGEDTFGTSFSGHQYPGQLKFSTAYGHEWPGHAHSPYSDIPYYIYTGEEDEKQRMVGYRFHYHDGVPFEDSLHMRFAARNHESISIVYWYTAVPVRPFFDMPPAEKRIMGSEVRRGEYDRPLPDTGEWWIAGDFEREFEELPGGAIDLSEPFHGRPWQKYSAIRNFVDFNHVYRGDSTPRTGWEKRASAVARATLSSPADTTAEIMIGYDDEMLIQVNGEEPLRLPYQQVFEGRRVQVPLREGNNDVAILLRNEGGQRHGSLARGAWAFSFRVTTDEGEVLTPRAPQ